MAALGPDELERRVHLPVSPCISLYLPVSPCISLYPPTSHWVPMSAKRRASRAKKARHSSSRQRERWSVFTCGEGEGEGEGWG